MTYSVFPNNTYTNSNTTNQSCWKVDFQQTIINSSTIAQAFGIYFIPVLTVTYPNKIFNYKMYFYYNSGYNVSIKACFDRAVIVAGIKIGGIIFLKNNLGID